MATPRFLVSLFVAVLLFFIAGTQHPRGGFEPVPTDDPHLQPCVNFAATSVNKMCNCIYCQTVDGVANASRQIVNGAIYKFSVSLKNSQKCTNKECQVNTTPTKCPPDPEAKPYWCDATVLATPWTKPPYVMENLTCHEPDF